MKRFIRPWLANAFGFVVALGSMWHAWHYTPPASHTDPPTQRRFSYPDHIASFSGRPATNTVRLSEVDIQHGMEVVGVEINGEAKAYLLFGMTEASFHIAHDFVGGEDVSVAYCPRLGTVRCFAIPQAKQDQLKLRGWINDTLEMTYGAHIFSIEDANLPAPEIPVFTTTIDEWRHLHPDSKIYLGEIRPRPLPSRPSEPNPIVATGRRPKSS